MRGNARRRVLPALTPTLSQRERELKIFLGLSAPLARNSGGLVIVHTGDGKGKTTAALGLALRAVGNGMPVLTIQFIKGKWKTGEREAAKAFGGLFRDPRNGRGVYLGHQGRGARQAGRRGKGGSS